VRQADCCSFVTSYYDLLMIRLREGIFAIFLGCFSSGFASANSDSQVWVTAAGTASLGSKWRLSQEVITRFSDKRNGLYEIESNTLLGLVLAKNVTLWGGYTHDPLYLGGHFSLLEHRAREQITFDNMMKLGRAKLNARFRLEQRWRSGTDGTAWRARPYVQLSLPVRGSTAINLSNETFVNLHRTSFQAQAGLDRMRNLISLSAPLAKRLKGEAGYMNQRTFVRRGPDTVDHVAFFAVSLRLP
jgi:hypothetical protein